MLIRGGSGCTCLSFIGARTVEARHRNTNQSEVDRELSAMVDKMVKHHPSNASLHRGIVKIFFAASEAASNSSAFPDHSRPQARHGLPRRSCQIRRVPDCGFRFGWRVGRTTHWCIIELLGIERHRGPTGHRKRCGLHTNRQFPTCRVASSSTSHRDSVSRTFRVFCISWSNSPSIIFPMVMTPPPLRNSRLGRTDTRRTKSELSSRAFNHSSSRVHARWLCPA